MQCSSVFILDVYFQGPVGLTVHLLYFCCRSRHFGHYFVGRIENRGRLD